ncbi:MAG: hypothetical protein HZC42_06895, partial [Candidatus Eisenbacteria bacterium]|nr:hypothetical protein [Candidatus Eisenbacteria bacterium]
GVLPHGVEQRLAFLDRQAVNVGAGPAAEKYGAEITLAMVVWGLWNHTALPAPAAPESEDEATGRGASE